MTGGEDLDPERSLAALAEAHGVLMSYVDATGTTRTADPEVLVAALQALGAPIASTKDAVAAQRERERDATRAAIDPVVVAWDRAVVDVAIRMPAYDRPVRSEYVLECENGEERRASVAVGDLETIATATVDGIEMVTRRLALTGVPFGVHRLTIELPSGPFVTHVIAAPTRGAASGPLLGERTWGAVAPAYALRGPHDHGIGTYTDLDRFGAWLSRAGGTVVGTLPLLPVRTSPPSPGSPYLPLSRRFWNELYVDLEAVPEWGASPAVARFLGRPDVQADLDRVRAAQVVDYATVARIKRGLLAACAGDLAASAPGRESALRAFLADHPDVVEYARFLAAGDRFGADWRKWPPRMTRGELRWADVDPERERAYCYAQWVAHEQVHAVAKRVRARGQVLALDLPLGTHPDGFDAWQRRDQLVSGLTVGAPPDGFFAGGQSWGFAPLHPQRVRTDGHAYFRASLAHHLAVGSLLRIDHVMACNRVFCVPDGVEARDGVYVRMPAEEVYAAICLEAWRYDGDVVGENLGTVAPEVREAMAEHGMAGMYVAQFSIDPDRDDVLATPAAGDVASFGTHDTPTFAAFLRGTDIDTRADVGFAELPGEREGRRRAVGALRSLVTAGEEAGPLAVLDATLARLAASDAAVVLCNPEDLWSEEQAQNLPGTADEHPNWQRRFRYSLTEMDAAHPGHAVLDRLAEIRPRPEPAATAIEVSEVLAGAGVSRLTDDDCHLFNEGRHFTLYEKLGAHPSTVDGRAGTYFAVWAPDAVAVSVVSDANGWDGTRHGLRPVRETGIWEGFVPGIGPGVLYKFRIRARSSTYEVDKADPFAFATEVPPLTASRVWDGAHEWGDEAWMASRGARNARSAPMSVYEVHLGSWRRVPGEGNRSLTYRELAPLLVEHCRRLGFTHVELMPVMEHPFYGSWGYQTTGYFAPTSRYGSPEDLMYLVDELHRHDIGVILDWVPSHFATDEFALGYFDGSFLYEHADPLQRIHPDWGSAIFNYGRNEVRSFLVSNACFWIDRFHADGLRIDAVASMLYLDYSRRAGEWVPNRYGGNENLEALEFIRTLNTELYRRFPDIVTVAEESTAWPGVSHPTYTGGLGFGYKWDMGWMHDTLHYLHRDPVHRAHHQDDLTFRMVYASTENFVLPLSHDEVVHGKGSLLAQMPGDDWQKFANLRCCYGYMHGTPGKKLLFMGSEFAQWAEWDHDRSLDWHLLDDPRHAGMQAWVAHLNRLHRDEPALHEHDTDPAGFAWIDASDHRNSVLAWERRGIDPERPIVVVCNFTPVPRPDYRIGVPYAGNWHVIGNSDAIAFGGSGYPVPDVVVADETPWHGRPASFVTALPPLGVLFLRREH